MSVSSFLGAISNRRTHYGLVASSTIPDSRIIEIVNQIVLHTPSAYNTQSARAVVLLGDNHRKLWQITADKFKAVLPEGLWAGAFKARFAGFEAAYGTVMFFEDQNIISKTKEEKPMVAAMMDEFSAHSTGMHHFNVWTALSAEGLGASLQHVNANPAVTASIIETFNLPSSWKPTAQLVFGTPKEDEKLTEKTFEAIEERVRVIA